MLPYSLTRALVRLLDGMARLLGRGDGRPRHLALGAAGEDAAYFHLRREGYAVVAGNWRSPRRRGELDLVGWDGGLLCFVEVKTRTSGEVVPAEAAVDAEKRRELRAMAREYVRSMHGDVRPPIRFDVVSVYCTPDGPREINLYRNAFRMA